MSPNAPAWVRVLWSFAWTFGQRRQVIRAWTWTNTARVAVDLRNLAFRCRHPRLWWEVRQRVRILQARRGYIDA